MKAIKEDKNELATTPINPHDKIKTRAIIKTKVENDETIIDLEYSPFLPSPLHICLNVFAKISDK